MAEMTALVTAVYREYSTSIAPGFENKSPAITSRFELFYDETVSQIAVRLTGTKMDTSDTDILPGAYMHDHLYGTFSTLMIRLFENHKGLLS